jgi:hypothetical protein
MAAAGQSFFSPGDRPASCRPHLSELIARLEAALTGSQNGCLHSVAARFLRFILSARWSHCG